MDMLQGTIEDLLQSTARKSYIYRNFFARFDQGFSESRSTTIPTALGLYSLPVHRHLFVGPIIGEGAHAKVYEGKYENQNVAIKIVHRGDNLEEIAKREARFAREVEMLSKISSVLRLILLGQWSACNHMESFTVIWNLEEDSEEYGSPLVLASATADLIRTRTEALLKKTKTSVFSKPIVMRAEYAHRPNLSIIGTPSFVLIQMAMPIVTQSGGQCHVLLMIADGQGWTLYEILRYAPLHNLTAYEEALETNPVLAKVVKMRLSTP
ncbi:uncharacterized protein LOC122076710 isoform X2 [Macadamia integrifolia]|uniref:uncharacterized protein LOC122076710 isoform X2 n=1 Tax=Macadamia integrifolia TaxID=60698 RepID=UPI001C4E43C0|nr:uncharacterized protein LOC122076710 isoform X2 [Macadamia integrifolia]XP_042498113.1 uncharacterized protein LOC122076710 isoform X2 [Macadamia integrifolia]